MQKILHTKNLINNNKNDRIYADTIYVHPNMEVCDIYLRYIIKSILAKLDHNHNSNKQNDKIIYSKLLGKYLVKNVYDRTDTD